MKLFKDFKTKKQLRKEIKDLEYRLLRQPFEHSHISYTQNHIETLRCSVEKRYFDDIPEEALKNQIVNGLVEEIKPFIEYSVEKGENGAQIFTGTIRVVGEDI